MDQSGSWLFTINVNVSGAGVLRIPCGLALDPQGTSMLQPMVLTLEGIYVKSYGDVKGPKGISIDEEGYSLVCEYSGNCISIFDPQGNKIHTIGDLTNPYGVALDPISDSLCVPDFGAKAVIMYSFYDVMMYSF